jgi:hypothetical protein
MIKSNEHGAGEVVAVDSAEAGKAFVTKSGRVLTEADIKALADEAERGYDLEQIRSGRVRRGRK